MIIRFPCSPEQAEIIADHFIEGKDIGMLPDERAWIISNVQKQRPGYRVLGAEMSLVDAEWAVQIMSPEDWKNRNNE
jgi:hypothetical protein